MNYASPDLTQHPPRSPHVRLGGYVMLPRTLDKCRATLSGKNGEYDYSSMLDRMVLGYLGIDAAALQAEVAKGSSDVEILAWITAHTTNKRTDYEIAHWSAQAEAAGPGTNETRVVFNELMAAAQASKREGVRTWFDYLDVDDYVAFGGP